MRSVIKSGKLSNGFERGAGRVVHIAEKDGFCRALCGTKPGKSSGLGFIYVDVQATCARCLSKQLKMRNEGLCE